MNLRLNKIYSPFLQIISGIMTIILGFLFYFNYYYVWTKIADISIILLTIYTITSIITSDPDNNKLSINLSLEALIGFLSILFINYFTDLYIAFFPLLIGIYILAIALSRFIRAYIFFVDKLKHKYLVLLDAIISLIFGFGLVIHPLQNINYLSYWLAFYFAFYGLSFILKGLNRLFFASDAQLSLPLPIILAALLPGATLDNIDLISNKTSDDIETDLEAFIYLREKGFGRFGHMDIAYKGKTYSYGAFDYHTHKLGGTYADGVLIVADRDKFLKHGNVFKEAVIVKYGIKLNEQQRELVESRIEDLLSRTKRFYSDAEIDDRNGLMKDNYDSYLANVYLNTKAKTYKFTHGPFKTYFVLSTNCVNLASYILRMKNLDIMNFKGLITPGTYLNYLNNEYLANSSIVVSRYVYGLDKNEK